MNFADFMAEPLEPDWTEPGAQVHFVAYDFTIGPCTTCGDHGALLPVGPDQALVCYECGQAHQREAEQFLLNLFREHMAEHFRRMSATYN